MNAVIIHEDICIGCGLCVRDCPGNCLILDNGKAHVRDAACIECGHCYAICPNHAVEMRGCACTDEPVTPMTEIDSDVLLQAMKSRRTIRQFAPKPVEAEKILKILEAGRYSPTGGNSQSVEYTILGGKQKEAEALCVDLFRKGKRLASWMVSYLKQMDIPDQFFFKGAPLVIVVSARNPVDGALASSYMELMAESLGLGVLYSGFFIVCTKLSRALQKLLALPKGQKAVTCMVIGYPAVNYQRIVPRKDLKVRML